MALELFTNEASTTVSSGGTTAPTSGTTETWTVASSASFPAAVTGTSQFHVEDPLNATTVTEIIAVTNVSGTTWTVTRGAESTTPVAHQSGFTVQQVITAGWANSVAVLNSPNTFSATPQTFGTSTAQETQFTGNKIYLYGQGAAPPTVSPPFLHWLGYCGGAAGQNGWDMGIDTSNHGGGQDFYLGPLQNNATTDRFYMNWPSGAVGIGSATPPSDSVALTVLPTTTTQVALALTQTGSGTGDMLDLVESSGHTRISVDSSFQIHTAGSGGGSGNGLIVNIDATSHFALTFAGTSHSYSWWINEADQGQLLLRYLNSNFDVFRFNQGQWCANIAPLDLSIGGLKAGTTVSCTTTGVTVAFGGEKLAFFGATPVAKPATTGTTTGFTAGSGTAVLSGSTFTGNTGSTAYTIGDVVNAMKLLGLLTA